MRIAIFGCGGVGANFGAHLARANQDVVFIARGQHLHAIKQNGLQLETPQNTFTVRPSLVTDNTEGVGSVDVVLLCVKAWQIEEAAKQMAPMITPHTMVIPLQNTILSTGILLSRLQPNNVLGGVCYTISYITGPGCIRGNGGSIILGELDNKRTDRIERFCLLCNSTGTISAEIPQNIQERMWKKFIWITSAGLVGAVSRQDCGIWRNNPESRALFETVIQEALSVAQAHEVPLSQDDLCEIKRFLDGRPPEFTTSMQRDILQGSRSELEYQGGAIVALARKAGIKVPVTEALYRALLPQELMARGKSKER